VSVSVDWWDKIIHVPQAYLTLVAGTIYEMDLNQFHLDLRTLEAAEAGMPYPHTHTHNTTVTIAGVVLARVIELVNGYTVTFEDGQYGVNMLGANTNIIENLNRNQVSVASANSAGLTEPQATLQQINLIKAMLGQNCVVEYFYTGTDNDSAVFYFYDTEANATTHDKNTGLLDTLTMTATFAGGRPTLMRTVE